MLPPRMALGELREVEGAADVGDPVGHGMVEVVFFCVVDFGAFALPGLFVFEALEVTGEVNV